MTLQELGKLLHTELTHFLLGAHVALFISSQHSKNGPLSRTKLKQEINGFKFWIVSLGKNCGTLFVPSFYKRKARLAVRIDWLFSRLVSVGVGLHAEKMKGADAPAPLPSRAHGWGHPLGFLSTTK